MVRSTGALRMLHEVIRSPSPSRFPRAPLLDSPPVLRALHRHSPLRASSAARLNLQRRCAVLRAVLLCTFVLLGMQEAQAAPIGMCADTAQSIEAPPPMFPADDAELRAASESTQDDCQSNNDMRFRVHEPGAPSDRLAPSAESPDEKVILEVFVPVFGVRSVPFAVVGQAFRLPEEHRWRGLRPPRD